ncbi:LysR family transcriptional regulator [Achromobacter ruhlandii]|uniref:HTH-type transcriptional regulator DmlR n=1 Tax=Achromobacter ruhlandii TaxID=72557 RepID=A0ABM8M234_9BURK|nr:LysR family transcriptional regulator [Achromobacter ruhlandii]AKP91754.1 putative transcriptional regulator LysR-family [Achromobacter xylosoxidans]AOU94987.1 LysR family transcriptional regulator [Achromobacter ruhlandii]MCZ8431630.1 LysR substrate-binding domain-containing protein [Achromobacter ruhlandii]MDC6091804.1 LysR substrate-binding domain-containing protein [Achromobacter ruhlandii]MDC6149508.1 LysR substrate-binding domain-containing protein [Achromobacter ruhlandii]
MERGALWEYQVFCAVAERQSFVLAARALGASPSAVTRAVQALERQVGAQLLLRSKSSVALTPQGESYFEYARELLRLESQAREALHDAQQGDQGRLRFSAPDLLGVTLLPAVLRGYAAQHPGVTVDIHYTDKAIDPIAEGLDFAIRGGFPASSDLLGARLWPYERLLCASPHYVACMGLPREPEELARHRLIMHTGPRVLKDWHLRRDKRIVRMHAEPAVRVSTSSGLMALALQGVGIARLADWAAAPEIARGTLVRVCPGYTATSARGVAPQMHAVYGSRSLPARARAMLAAIRQGAGAG